MVYDIFKNSHSHSNYKAKKNEPARRSIGKAETLLHGNSGIEVGGSQEIDGASSGVTANTGYSRAAELHRSDGCALVVGGTRAGRLAVVDGFVFVLAGSSQILRGSTFAG